MDREYTALRRAQDRYKEAHSTLADDRNSKGGDAYEAQKALNAAVEKRLRDEFAADWVSRWPMRGVR